MTFTASNSDQGPVASPSFPRALFSVSRIEVDQAPFTIKQGLTDQETTLDTGLAGYLFIVGPAGSLDSPWDPQHPCLLKPTQDGYTPLYNGDGMIYRIQFDQGNASLKTKIARSTSYIADELVHDNPCYPSLNFENFGIARNSIYLGASTQLSVTLTPIRFREGDPYRLLLTVDMGRPHEIDPVTLDIVQPIGLNREWKAVNPLFASFPFQLAMSCAHPSFDFDRKELYTINLGRSISRFLPTIRQLFKHVPALQQVLKTPIPPGSTEPPEVPKQVVHQLWNWFSDGVDSLIRSGYHQSQAVEDTWKAIVEAIAALNDDDYVELLRWRGNDPYKDSTGDCFDRWQIILEDGSPLKIQQTLHQMWVTKHFIVLIDTAFKISLEELLPFEHDEMIAEVETLFRDLADDPQLADTPLYIIRRDDLEEPWQGTSQQRTVKARRMTIPREIAHYVVEYEDQNGIVLHTIHSCATDAAETIRHFDRSVFEQGKELLDGMLCDGMDINWIGSYVINPNGGENAIKPCLIQQDYCWGDPVYAYRNMTLEPSGQIDDMYWIFFGGWEELLSKYVFDLYKNYKYRTLCVEEVLKANREGRAATLCHVHIERRLNANQELELKLTTPDSYTFPPGHFANSPQFIPRHNGDGSFTDGYLTCLVFSTPEDGRHPKELWIFDASHLSQGPKYRLCSDQLNCGFTIHTTWLPDIAAAPPSHYSVREDFEPLIAKLVQEYEHSWLPEHHQIALQLRQLFDQIYQQYDQ